MTKSEFKELINENIITNEDICKALKLNDIGEFSDGYHTFNQLYHQRAILFATIVNQNKDISWKSLKHNDGNYCFDSNGEWFIVGIDTPEGSYTYHYKTKDYWDYFHCEELPVGKFYDGHTEEDVTRLLSLPSKESHWVWNGDMNRYMQCWNCQEYIDPKDSHGKGVYNTYCPNCGARNKKIINPKTGEIRQ